MSKELVETVVGATGLPQEPIQREFHSLLEKHGTTPEDLTLDDLREIMADYLNEVFLELAESDAKSA
ncbi:MAG: hypothetical protein J7501_15845 [Bdellovibrio sp.]|nr:hypothetical protein [Bdellovibrio sp.]